MITVPRAVVSKVVLKVQTKCYDVAVFVVGRVLGVRAVDVLPVAVMVVLLETTLREQLSCIILRGEEAAILPPVGCAYFSL